MASNGEWSHCTALLSMWRSGARTRRPQHTTAHTHYRRASPLCESRRTRTQKAAPRSVVASEGHSGRRTFRRGPSSRPRTHADGKVTSEQRPGLAYHKDAAGAAPPVWHTRWRRAHTQEDRDRYRSGRGHTVDGRTCTCTCTDRVHVHGGVEDDGRARTSCARLPEGERQSAPPPRAPRTPDRGLRRRRSQEASR